MQTPQPRFIETLAFSTWPAISEGVLFTPLPTDRVRIEQLDGCEAVGVTLRSGLLVWLVLGVSTACGGNAARSPVAPTVFGVYQGMWTGQTNQSERFGFVVAGNQVTRLDFNVSYTGISCSGGFGTGTIGPLASISNAEFSAAYTSPSGDLTWSIVGTFVSPTVATGTLQVTITRANSTDPASGCSPPSVQMTWTAQKGS